MELSLLVCKLLIILGGMFGLLRMEGGKFINFDFILGICFFGNDFFVRCNVLRVFFLLGFYNIYWILNVIRYISKFILLK